MQHHQLVRLPRLPQRREARGEAEQIGELDQVRRLVRQVAAQRRVLRIADRRHRGQPVEPAAQQHEHEPAVLPHLGEA